MRNKPREDLTGRTFGRWKVLYRVNSVISSYMCECSCDHHTRRIVNAASLKSGRSKSCGCLMIEMASRRVYTDEEIVLHRKWNGMKNRCYNPNVLAYPDYGGRGIYICDEWLNDKHKFTEWALNHGFKIGLTIDRIDNDGPYAPWNCRFVTDAEQAINRRSNRIITLDGVSKTLREWQSLIGNYASSFAVWQYTHTDDEIRERLRYLIEKVKENPDSRPIHRETNSPVTFMGETLTLPEWARKFGVSKSVIYNATRRSMSEEEALKIVYDRVNGINRHIPCITVDGREYTVPEWAKILHVNKHMLFNKLRAISDKPEYIRRLLSKKISIFDRPPKDIGGATGTSSKLPR